MGVVPGRVSSVTLAVRDLAASDRFYTEVFGFERVSGNEILTRFRLENLCVDLIQAEILEAETGVPRMPAMPGPITLAIALAEPGDVDACQARAEAAGVRVLAPAEDKPSGPRILFLCDPDGHIWEIGCFPPGTWGD